MKRVLVTGIGRSGTGYMAKLLTEAGAPCGHEAIYDSGTQHEPEWGEAQAESSWFSAPWLDTVPDRTFVLHVVRHPVKWLASWSQTVWRSDRLLSAPIKYITRHTGIDWTREAQQDVISASMKLWVAWNAMIEASPTPTLRMRVEQDREPVVRALRHLGNHRCPPLPESAMNVPTDVNSRPHDELTWADCKDRPGARRFREKAKRYGYDVMETQ
jgi:hypothetical protein